MPADDRYEWPLAFQRIIGSTNILISSVGLLFLSLVTSDVAALRSPDLTQRRETILLVCLGVRFFGLGMLLISGVLLVMSSRHARWVSFIALGLEFAYQILSYGWLPFGGVDGAWFDLKSTLLILSMNPVFLYLHPSIAMLYPPVAIVMLSLPWRKPTKTLAPST